MDDLKFSYAAPEALLKHCRRALRKTDGAARAGSHDKEDVKALYRWMADNSIIDGDDAWVRAGMAAKAEFGEDGLELWETLATQSGGLSDESLNRWKSFATEPTAESVTIASLMKSAHAAGWSGIVRKSTSAMFSQVAALAAASGASLHGGMLMTGTDDVIADLGYSILESFIATNTGLPAANPILLPDTASHRPLFELLNTAIGLIIGLAERAPKTFRVNHVADVLAVLSAVHPTVLVDVCARIRNAGVALPENKVTSAVLRFEARVNRAVRTAAGWTTDSKGKPDGSNTDNVAVGMRIIGAAMRFNEWSNRQEIRYSEFGNWEAFQEKDFDHLIVTFGNGQYNYHPPENLLKRALKSLAREDSFDPVKLRLAQMQAAWDGVSRLDGWLSQALGTPNDALHAAIGRNLLGGICKRIRRPGCKHDEVVILMGPEDTFKSTFCRALAMDDAWFTDSVDFSGSPQNTIPQLFGRTVVELAELDGMERREVQHIKRFLSAQTDNVTLKYEAFTSDHARRCIFIGTSNEDNPLRGDAGNRRFLPVHVGKCVDMDYVRANLDQLLGEAAVLEANGELFLIPKAVIPDMRAKQESVRAQSDFEIYLEGWFQGSAHGYIMAHDLAMLLKDATGRSVTPSQYSKTMRRLGFDAKNARADDRVGRVWYRGGMSHRYELRRDGLGRLSPKQMFADVSRIAG